MEHLSLRLSAEQKARWKELARARGVSLTQFIVECVEGSEIPATLTAQIEQQVEKILTERVRELVWEIRHEAREEIEQALKEAAPPSAVPSLAPTRFDPQCEDVHLHRPGV